MNTFVRLHLRSVNVSVRALVAFIYHAIRTKLLCVGMREKSDFSYRGGEKYNIFTVP